MDIMELVRNIGAIASMILAVVAVLTAASKTVRSFWGKMFHLSSKEIREENQRQTNSINEISEKVDVVLDRIDDIEDRIDKIEGVSRQDCRNTIKEIYYKYAHLKKIPLYERKTVDKTWTAYQKFPHANSYAALLYNEICKWEIEPPTTFDLTEDE